MAKFSFKILRSLPAHEKKLTISTALTLMRLILIPALVTSMVLHDWKVAFILFSLAAITDVLDGWLARWLNEHTFLGACLDPVVDKLLVLSVFATLAIIQTPLFVIPYWFVLFVLIKESIIVLGALGIFIIRGHVRIRPTVLGKATALVQVLFITWLFGCYFMQWSPTKTFYVWLALVISLLISSLTQYVRIGVQQWKNAP